MDKNTSKNNLRSSIYTKISSINKLKKNKKILATQNDKGFYNYYKVSNPKFSKKKKKEKILSKSKIMKNNNIYNNKNILNDLSNKFKTNLKNKLSSSIYDQPFNKININNIKKKIKNQSIGSLNKEICINEISKTYVDLNNNDLSYNSKFRKNKLSSIFKYYKPISSSKNKKTNRSSIKELKKNKSKQKDISNNIQNNIYYVFNINNNVDIKIESPKKKNFIGDPKFSNIYSSSYKNSNIKIDKNEVIKKNKKFTVDMEYVINKKDNDKYKIISLLGQGSYSCVYKAENIKFNKKVAIKFYNKQENFSKTREKSIKREISILGIIKHNNIIKFIDCFADDNYIYLVTELVEGLNLFEILKIHYKNNKKLGFNFIYNLMYEVLKTLEYLHKENIYHRDIKLENIMYDKETKKFKLIDFGFSTLVSDKKYNIFCGTPSYMSPSLMNKEPSLGSKNDVWAMGVLFYVIVKGKFPFKANSDKDLKHNINNLEISSSNKKLNEIFTKVLDKNEDTRINISEFKNLFLNLYTTN